jgi:hypothetical protein
MQDSRDDNHRTDASDTQGAAPDAAPADGTLDSRYLAIVGGLMVLIIILLAWLWLHERVARNAAYRELVAARGNSALAMQLQATLGRGMAGPQTRPARPIQRDDLPAETVNWNGAPRSVLRLSAAAGERVGLRPGDVVVVAPAPATTTAPTSGPASRGTSLGGPEGPRK